ncbi:hypothetical protein Pelo_4542 [Pelomyxa schiedti]|nr:hypothetical protein Pelo_4542 [Pelomyxa schiedti]
MCVVTPALLFFFFIYQFLRLGCMYPPTPFFCFSSVPLPLDAFYCLLGNCMCSLWFLLCAYQFILEGVSRSLQTCIGGGRARPTPLRTFTNGAGTPIYLPPQMHTRRYGIQGDMWEFAVLLSELLQGTIPEVTIPMSIYKISEFMRLQRTSLSQPEIAEVDRLCADAGDIPIAECLSRRIAIISALHSEPKMNNAHRACVGLFSVIVESCLSILGLFFIPSSLSVPGATSRLPITLPAVVSLKKQVVCNHRHK